MIPPPLVIADAASYNIEEGRNKVIYSTKKMMIEGTEQDIPYYYRFFMGHGK